MGSASEGFWQQLNGMLVIAGILAKIHETIESRLQ